jgi:predicted DsbA family dithiol-disulfide isomerase
MKDANKQNLSCDVETGICDTIDDKGIQEVDLNTPSKIKVLYYTDPICSACWAIEPELKKFKLEYGHYVEIEYKMGGLLPGWEGFSDNNNGISKPSDVAHHWDEVGEASGMSIDGDVWLKDPLSSSFPPSIAFKAAQNQGEEFAQKFLRRIREKVFLENKNIAKDEVLISAITECGGDTAQFKKDYKNDATAKLFKTEMNEGRQFGVRGFPTFIFVGADGKGFMISGTSGYSNYVSALHKAIGKEVKPKVISYAELDLLKKYKFLATREISVVLSQTDEKTTQNLKALVVKGLVKEEKQKYGSFWRYSVD